jgi:phage terminase Nu1 subunit (DNA packaging protein)
VKRPDLMTLYGWDDGAWERWRSRGCLIRSDEAGLWDAAATIGAVFKWQEENREEGGQPVQRGALAAEKLAAQAAIRRMNELKLARVEGKMIDIDELRALWGELVTEFRRISLSIPVRCAAELPHLTRHDINVMERECKDALRLNTLTNPEIGPLPVVRE